MTKRRTLDGKSYAGNQHVRFDEGEVAAAAKPRRGSLLYKNNMEISILQKKMHLLGFPMFCKGFLYVAIALSSARGLADETDANNMIAEKPAARELLSKVWVPDPQGATRLASERDDWYDPSRSLFVGSDFQIFKTAAAWHLSGQNRTFVLRLRSLDDTDERLFDGRGFCEQVARILKLGVSVMVNKNHAKPVFKCLDGVGEFSTNAISIHVRIDNRDQILGLKSVDLVSKRYLNVDGRLFYIGVKGGIISSSRGDNVNACAIENEALLRAWERDIRRSTWAHRLSEHGGDAEAAINAIKSELSADKAQKENRSLPLHERFKLAQKLLADRGYNSTNVPSREVERRIFSEAGFSKTEYELFVEKGQRKDTGEMHSSRSSTHSGKRTVRVRGLGGLVAHALLPEGAKSGIVVCFAVIVSGVFIMLVFMLLKNTTSDISKRQRSEDVGASPETSGQDGHRCWICGDGCLDYDTYSVKMYGEHVQRTERGWGGSKVYHTWRTAEIEIPCCARCQEEIEKSESAIIKVSAMAGLVAFVVVVGGVFFLSSESDVVERLLKGIIPGFLLGLMLTLGGPMLFKHKHWKRVAEYPMIQLLLKKQWKFGSRPMSAN